jgi:hypothetical protein
MVNICLEVIPGTYAYRIIPGTGKHFRNTAPTNLIVVYTYTYT